MVSELIDSMGGNREENRRESKVEELDKEFKELKELVSAMGAKLVAVSQQVEDGQRSFKEFMEEAQEARGKNQKARSRTGGVEDAKLGQKVSQLPRGVVDEEVEEQGPPEMEETSRNPRNEGAKLRDYVDEVGR